MTPDDLINTPPYDAIFIIGMLVICSGSILCTIFGGKRKTMEPQTVTELKQQLARIKTAYTQTLDNCCRADENRLAAIINQDRAEREHAAHVTKETKTNLKTAREKVKQASEAYQTADKAFLTVYKQKIHLEDELKRVERKPQNA